MAWCSAGFDGDYLRHDGPEHVLCFAPTRTGKGVGLVVPSLLTWPGCCIVHDIKGENWSLTAGLRARFGRVLLFDPTNAASAAYNPLLEVRRGEWEVRDVQNVADVLVDPEGSLERRNHWEKTSHSLLVGAILHVLYAETDKTLAGVAAFLSDPRRPIETTLRAMMTTPHLGKKGPHPVVASAARELLNKSRQRALRRALHRDVVPGPLSRSGRGAGDAPLRLAHRRHRRGGAAATLYLVVPPSDISRTKPLIRLILNQIGRRLTEDLNASEPAAPAAADARRVPGARPARLLRVRARLHGGLRPEVLPDRAVAEPDREGLRRRTTRSSTTAMSACSFATNDERTAKRVSDALGTATEMRAMKNYAGHRLSPWLGHLMVSRQETARPLLTPGEVMQLPPTDEIVMVAGAPPIRAKKARYFEDRVSRNAYCRRRAQRKMRSAPSPTTGPRSLPCTRQRPWRMPATEMRWRRPTSTARMAMRRAIRPNAGLRREPVPERHKDIARGTTNQRANGVRS